MFLEIMFWTQLFFVITASLDLRNNNYISFDLFFLLLLDFLCSTIIKVMLQNMPATLYELVQTCATFWTPSREPSLDVFHGCCSYRCMNWASSFIHGPFTSQSISCQPHRFNNILLHDVRDSFHLGFDWFLAGRGSCALLKLEFWLPEMWSHYEKCSAVAPTGSKTWHKKKPHRGNGCDLFSALLYCDAQCGGAIEKKPIDQEDICSFWSDLQNCHDHLVPVTFYPPHNHQILGLGMKPIKYICEDCTLFALFSFEFSWFMLSSVFFSHTRFTLLIIHSCLHLRQSSSVYLTVCLVWSSTQLAAVFVHGFVILSVYLFKL